MNQIKEMDLLKIDSKTLDDKSISYIIEPLLPGYGQTIGNALRRVLLSSLRGSAITAVKINDASHEFSSIAGVKEDCVEIILNLKSVRIAYGKEEPTTIKLEEKGSKVVRAGDFKTPAGAKIINKDAVIATLNKDAVLNIEARVESGIGYLPTERMDAQNYPLGMIAVDAIFTPIRKINCQASHTRVGQQTNFDKLIIDIETDGSISSLEALKNTTQIISDYFTIISQRLLSLSSSEVPSSAKKEKAVKQKKVVKSK